VHRQTGRGVCVTGDVCLHTVIVCVRETEAIIGKAPRLVIRTPCTALALNGVRYSGRNIAGQHGAGIKWFISVSPHEQKVFACMRTLVKVLERVRTCRV